MKSRIVLFPAFTLFCSLVLISCNKEKIVGSGNIITDPRTVTDFYGVSVFGSSNVFISYANNYSVSVKGYENIVPKLRTYVENGILVVKFADDVNITNDNSEVYITMPSLISVSDQGSSDIKVSGSFIGMENLSVSTSGSGDIEFDNGSVQNIVLKISGSGDISAYGMLSKNATININGSGDAQVSASDKLKATISGSGNVYYKGNPTIESSVSGSGQVIKQ